MTAFGRTSRRIASVLVTADARIAVMPSPESCQPFRLTVVVRGGEDPLINLLLGNAANTSDAAV